VALHRSSDDRPREWVGRRGGTSVSGLLVCDSVVGHAACRRYRFHFRTFPLYLHFIDTHVDVIPCLRNRHAGRSVTPCVLFTPSSTRAHICMTLHYVALYPPCLDSRSFAGIKAQTMRGSFRSSTGRVQAAPPVHPGIFRSTTQTRASLEVFDKVRPARYTIS